MSDVTGLCFRVEFRSGVYDVIAMSLHSNDVLGPIDSDCVALSLRERNDRHSLALLDGVEVERFFEESMP